MSDVTRLWLVVPDPSDRPLKLPAGLELAGVVAARAEDAQGLRLAAQLGTQLHADPELAVPASIGASLTRWAARFAREQCALLCPAEVVRRAVGEALGVGEAAAFELRPGGCAALDWSVDEPGAAPALVGFDLDWLPVFLPTGRPKFPGGPGVASSSRA